MRIIVTGGAGFIGSHIVDCLLSHNHEVVCIDNESANSNSQFYWNGEAENHVVDICDYEKIRPLFDNAEAVFHLAAESRIQNSIDSPIKTVQTNAVGTMSVLQCAAETRVKRFINSSTSSAYGMGSVPNREHRPTNCLTPYSASKVCAESLCKIYTQLHGLEALSLRYFNVYGPRQPLKGHYAPVVGLFFEQAKKNVPLTIVGDGFQRRDFTYISDVVDANMKALTTFISPEDFGGVINIGTGKNYSIRDIADAISTNQEFIPPRPGESRETLAENLKAERVLGWVPKHDLMDWIHTKKLAQGLC